MLIATYHTISHGDLVRWVAGAAARPRSPPLLPVGDGGETGVKRRGWESVEERRRREQGDYRRCARAGEEKASRQAIAIARRGTGAMIPSDFESTVAAWGLWG